MDGKDLKEALEATTEKGAVRSGYEQLIRQKLALKDDVDLSSIDENTLKALAGTDESVVDAEAAEEKGEKTENPDDALGNALGLEDEEDIKAVGEMSDEDKEKLVAAIGGEEIKESVAWTVNLYNLMEASDIDLAIILKEHYGLKKDEVKEILRERNTLSSSESRLQEKFLDRVLEAAKKLNFESIHQVFEDDEPEATHISNSSTVQSEFVPAQPSLEKAPAKLKESEEIPTSPALEAELEKASENFFKVKLDLHVNPGNQMLYAHGDLGWRKANPEARGKDHYGIHADIKGGKVASYWIREYHAYDDADYYIAYSFNLKDWYFRNHTDKTMAQCNTVDEVLENLGRLNAGIKPVMMYDSQESISKDTRIQESSVEDGYREIPLKDENTAVVIESVLGQLSDGYWENNRSSDKYWRFASVKNNILFISNKRYTYEFRPDVRYVRGVRINTSRSVGWDNGFLNKSEEEIKKFFAQKAKFLVKEEGLEWSRNNQTESEFVGGWRKKLTVADIYAVYDWLMGRARAMTSEVKIEESTLTDALDDAMDHLRAAEKHNDDYDTVAVEQDIRGAEGKIHKAQMIAR